MLKQASLTLAYLQHRTAGSFLTSYKAEVKITLPELNVMAHIFAPSYVTSPKSNYDVNFGRNLLREVGINLDFQNNYIGNQNTNAVDLL